MATRRRMAGRAAAVAPFMFALLASGCTGGDDVPRGAATVVDAASNESAKAHAEHAPQEVTEAGEPSAAAGSDFLSETTPQKPKREPIYDEEADGATLIAAALERARQEHKHVLIEWGGNWCGWCYRLHDVFTQDETVRPIVHEEFELVLVDSGRNRALMEQYGGKGRRFSYPHLTVLDGAGEVLVNQNTEPLEVGQQHDPAKVAQFLKQWAPEPIDAEALLASTLERAAAEEKRVLMHVGNPYCGWCKVLSRFLREHESLFAQDYVDLKIDTMRMSGGEAVAARFQPEKSPGVPWMVILSGSGEVLATSVASEGNCGYPYHPKEIEHFLSMLTETRQRMSDSDLEAIRAALETYREERETKLRAEEAAERLSPASAQENAKTPSPVILTPERAVLGAIRIGEEGTFTLTVSSRDGQPFRIVEASAGSATVKAVIGEARVEHSVELRVRPDAVGHQLARLRFVLDTPHWAEAYVVEAPVHFYGYGASVLVGRTGSADEAGASKESGR